MAITTNELIDVKELTPFKKFIMSIGEIPTSYLESMTYYELLCWFCNYLQNTVIPTVNNNAEAVEELQTLFTELKEYIDTYFGEELQEKVDVKLDEMAEDGTLENIIEKYINNIMLRVYTTVDGLKASGLQDGYRAKTLGYYTVNDGGGAEYYITATMPETGYAEILNNGNYAQLVIYDDSVNIKQLGAYGNGEVDDTTSFTKFANSSYKRLYIPDGTYNVSNILRFDNKEIIGIGNPEIDYVSQTTADEHYIKFTTYIKCENIKFNQKVNNTCIVGVYNCSNSIFKNCQFISDGYICGSELDLYTNNHDILIDNCYFNIKSVNSSGVNQAGGIWVREYVADKESYNITFNNCRIDHQSNDEAIACWDWNGKVHHVFINNTKIITNENSNGNWFITFDVDNSSFNNCYLEAKQTTIDGAFLGYNINKNIYFNDTTIKLNASTSNAFSSNLNATFNNCYIENSAYTHFIEKVTIKNSYIKISTILISLANFDNNTIEITGTQNTQLIKLDGGNLYIKNCRFIPFNFSGTIFIQILSNFTSFKIINTQFNVTFSNLSWWLFTNTFVGNVDIENCDIGGNIYGTGTCTGRIINNTIPVSSLNNIGSIKYNNNFNISA